MGSELLLRSFGSVFHSKKNVQFGDHTRIVIDRFIVPKELLLLGYPRYTKRVL